MSLALYRKYRPSIFADVIGQEYVTTPLSNALTSGNIHHAYLFSGPRGCGKTSSARIMARSLNCEKGPTPNPCGTCQSCKDLVANGPGSLDVIELDAATHGLVDDARDTVIFEDSFIGRTAAQRSGARLIPIDNRNDLNWDKIKSISQKKEGRINVSWKSNNLNVLIPMAGSGSRFENAGYSFPKPLIEVNKKPMIQLVVENLNIDARFIYIVQKAHFEKYNLDYLLRLVTPNCEIVQTNGLTDGAASTTLLAREFIDNDNSLLIANSDQYLEWNSGETLYSFMGEGIDGGIVTFRSMHPKWSFVRLNDQGIVLEVAEKKPISDIATAGIYFWRRGSDYVKYADLMIEKNIRTNGEFYVCPVFNQAIEDKKIFRIKEIEKMWGLGTPEDLNYFLKNHKDQNDFYSA